MAITFNGTSQYLRVANNASLSLTTSVTVMAWMNTSATTQLLGTNQRIMSRYLSGATANEAYGMDLQNGVCRFLIGNTTSVSAVMGPTASTNVWWHLCGTYDGSNMVFYVNGAQVGSAARTGLIPTSTGALSVGADYNGSAASEYFRGSLEDVRLYNRALSQAEIQTAYICRGTANIKNGLILNLLMDEGRRGATLAASAVVYDTGPLKLNATNIVANAVFADGFLRKRRFS